MTNNQLTRERLEKIKSWRETYGAGSNVMLPAEEAEELARMILAAMDSEPVAWMHNNNDIGIPAITVSQKIGHYWMAEFENVQPLYRHAQPAPETEREPIAWLNDAYLARGVVDGEAGSEDAGPGYIPVYREASPAQPAPVVPEEKPMPNPLSMYAVDAVAAIAEAKGWNACRAAMLQAGTLTNEDTRQVDELTMWIKRLVRSLKNANPDSKLPREAMDYLTAKGLISVGDILR